MFWTEEKLQNRINELEPYRYREAAGIGPFRMREDEAAEIGARPPGWSRNEAAAAGDGEERTVGLGYAWSGRDRYVWLSVQAEVPAAWAGRSVLGRFDFGRTGGGNNSGFESLLYIDGAPYQGVDTNHKEVFLPPDVCGKTVTLQFRLWSGLGGYEARRVNEHRIACAELCWLDEAADDLYYTAAAVLETVKILPEDRPERAELLALLDRAFLLLDWSKPGSERFYASAAQARDTLRSGLEVMPKTSPVEVRCIGHTHIDVAWLWRLRHTREKAARSFATVLRLMERFPDYVFLQTQPQLYAYIKRDYPDIYESIRSRVEEGRWEAGGAMWLEADCNLTSGESLVRQILYGTRFFREEFGTECKYLWLPDVFGYSWALPQILAKSGIEAFMTTKISWNQYNRMPHDTFKWRGIDGTEILTHFITTPDQGHREGSFYYTYNGEVTPYTVQGIWKAYRNKELNRKLLLSYGYGDGGGGVNREMLELRRRLEKMPGLPQVTTGRADAYFEELKETVERSDRYVHTWDGELYLELHRGTYTSQAYNKKMNRKLELLYREAEWMGVLAAASAGEWGRYRQAELHEGWTILLRNQFHDIIPGSSIREVYEDSREEYGEAERIGLAAWSDAARLLVADVTAGADGFLYTVFNSSSFLRSDTVSIPAEPGNMNRGTWTSADGKPLAAQRSEEAWQVYVPDLAPLGCARLRFVPEGQAEENRAEDTSGGAPFRYGGSWLETPYYRLEWNGSGQLTRVYDREAEREVLASGAAGNVLQVFEDRPKSRHEAWDIDIFYMEKVTEITDLVSVRLIESGALCISVEFVWRYMDSQIVQTMTAYAHSRRLDFRTEADWREQRQLLKAAFAVEVRSTEAAYDIQFGNVRRPTHWNTSWDWARFETVGHQWADLSERDYGVSLLNDCKYGYDIKDNVLRLTLIKSAMVPDDTADQGEHAFTYSLLPHRGDWLSGGTVEEAWCLNRPLTSVQGAAALPEGSLFRTDSATVFVDAVKKAEDREAVILRLHEFGGRRGSVRLASDWEVESWQECDLLERPVGEPLAGAEVELRMKPYEIKTFLVAFRQAPQK